MKKGVVLIVIITILSFNLMGCWDYSELTDREIVIGVGIDKGKEKGEILLTIQAVIPEKISTPMKSPGDTTKSVHVITTSGKSMSEAITRYNQRSYASPFFQNNRIYIIGEELARDGIEEIINYLGRSIEHRTNAFILVCKGKASDVVNWKTEYTSLPGDYIFNLVNYVNYTITLPSQNIHDIALNLSGETVSSYTSGIELINSNKEINYFGAALFKNDKLVGWLNREETRGLLWLNNKFRRALLETKNRDDDIKKLAYRIAKSKTKVTPKKENGNIKMLVDIKEEGWLLEYDGGGDVSSPEYIKTLEKKIAEEIKMESEECLRKAQVKYKTDVFGFGERIHKKYPKDWEKISKDWNEIYPQTEVEINVNVKLKGTGKITNPIVPWRR